MKLLDLSLPLSEETPLYPGDPAPEFRPLQTISKNGWNTQLLTIHSHLGTHVDAPYHRFPQGKKLDEFPLNTFWGPAVCLPLNDDLSLVKTGDIVFFQGGSDTNKISLTTAQKLLKKKVTIVGIDSLSVDNEPFKIHDLLLSHNILIVENLVNLQPLVGKRFECIIAPLPLKAADGAPCRVFAKITEE